MSDWQPLAGITVVDLSQQLPGPFASLLLRTLGATIIKVEPLGGEVAREVDPPMYQRINAGKEIVFLDLKSDAGRERLHELVAAADVFLEGFRPGVAARLSADWETLSTLNPRLVYVSLSGFGTSGPMVTVPGHDLNFLAVAGGLPAGLPESDALIRVPWVDLASATNAALLIVTALHDRAATGIGRRLELALLDAAVVWSNTKLPRPGTEGAYGVLATGDGQRVAISILENPMWERCCTAFGWSDWAQDPELADTVGRRDRAAEIADRVRAEIGSRTMAELDAIAAEHDLPFTRVNDTAEVPFDPQITARGLFPDAGHWRPLGPAAPAIAIVLDEESHS